MSKLNSANIKRKKIKEIKTVLASVSSELSVLNGIDNSERFMDLENVAGLEHALYRSLSEIKFLSENVQELKDSLKDRIKFLKQRKERKENNK